MSQDPRPEVDRFDALVRQHGPWLIRWFAARLPRGDPAAEDLAQETFMVLHRNRGAVRAPERIAAYLIGVGRRLLWAEIERRRRRKEIEAATPPSPGPAEGEGELEGALREALRSLPEELERAVEVYYTRELTYEQAAEVLGVPRATVQSRLRRALAMLRRRFGRSGVPLSEVGGKP